MLTLGKRPLVSVVLASYNHAPFVAEAVGSVLRQTLRDLELIVVDDGSSDETPGIVAAIRDRRIRLIRLAENRRAHPRNAALGAARGRYVAFQNSDDAWHPDKLARQIDELERRSGAAACFTGVALMDEGGAPARGTWADGLFAVEPQPSAWWLHRFFHHGNCLCVSSAVVRRAATERVGGFRGSLVQLGDLDLWVRLAGVGELAIVPDALTRMRIRQDGNASAPSPAVGRRSLLEYADVLERYVEEPARARLHEAFPGQVPQDGSGAVRSAALAAYAWTLGPAHRLFADRVLGRLVDDAAAREEIAARLGVGVVRGFFARRGEIAVAAAEASAS